MQKTRAFPLHPRSLLIAAVVACALTAVAPAHAAADIDPDEMEVVRKIHACIVATKEAETAEEMKPYSGDIPGSKVSYEMTPIPHGEFLMGSPEDEDGHKPDEGPQHRVEVAAFWMGKVPVTWNEFELFMYPDRLDDASSEGLDAVSRPTPPYVDMSFGMGKDRHPAISMTHHAASKYCQWLSAKTGHFYRLPTEAEWEYAARAGTTSPWSFGDDPEEADAFAWYDGNSNSKTQPVGQKEPNPWGLHDMHGNVWEWTLDQYIPERYQEFAESTANNPWAKPTKEYPRVVRGGSWNDALTDLRSAARRPSESDWKMLDPQLPQSVWYHTNALWLGFRIVRPLDIPTPEEMYEFWNR